MNETVKNKREWVKTAAIIFLSVMLVLTFFSNTIMNYSLPEVATQYVQSGTITAKIRGTGIIESGDPYEIKAKESRKVTSVAVKTGDTVQKGDVLLYLEDTESEELKAARNILKEKREAYEDAVKNLELRVLKGEVSQSAANNAENGNISSISTYQNLLLTSENEIQKQEKSVNEAKNQIAELNTIKQQVENGTIDTSAEEKALKDAQASYDACYGIIQAANDEIAVWQAEIGQNNQVIRDYEDGKIESSTVSGNDIIYIYAVTREQYETAKANNQVLNTRIQQKQLEVRPQTDALPGLQAARDKAQKAYDDKKNAQGTNLTNINNQLIAWNAELEKRNTKLQELTSAKDKMLNDIVSEISLGDELKDLKEAVAEARELVTELEEKATGATIDAEISGTISSINVVAGQTFQMDSTVVVLQPEGKGYTLSFSVTNDQAKRVSVGDKADLINAWRYDDVNVTLSSIKPDKNNPGQSKVLTFDVTGDVVAGQTLNLSVGQRSANYDLIVPNSAIKEDANGKFILIVESKSSPLGTRYIATRVDIEVIAADETQSAITGALYGYEYVITTATKPVEAGKQVRLADN